MTSKRYCVSMYVDSLGVHHLCKRRYGHKKRHKCCVTTCGVTWTNRQEIKANADLTGSFQPGKGQHGNDKRGG